MIIKILSFTCEIQALKNNNIFSLKIAQKYPGALWVYYLKTKCQYDLEFQTIDITLNLIKNGMIDPGSVAVFQHNLDKDAEQLIKLGAHPFLLSMYESPLYSGKFYDSIDGLLGKYQHIKIFGANNYKDKNLSQAYFPSFSSKDLKSPKQCLSWNKRRFASMVMGNKYVLARPLSSYHNFQDRIWWFIKFIRQHIKGYKLSKKKDTYRDQLQDKRYEVLVKMLNRGILNLYGGGWDKLIRIPPSVAKKLTKFLIKKNVFTIENKNEIISTYKFNICFENISFPGYITEKIIDAIVAKTIPVYYGAPDISNYIPPNAFIDATKFVEIDDLIDYMLSITLKEAEEIIENGQKFLRSSQGLKFSYENIAEDIIYELGVYLKD
jgi:hypothetical protein